MINVDTVIETARKSFQDGKYFHAIFHLNQYLDKYKEDKTYLAINIALYVIYEFREREDLKATIQKNLTDKNKWETEELNIAIAKEFLAYESRLDLQEKAKAKAGKYCDKNLAAGGKSFDTYFLKARTFHDEVDPWLHFLDLSLKRKPSQTDLVLEQVERWIRWHREITPIETVLKWLQELPKETTYTRLLKASCYEKIGDTENALALFNSLRKTQFARSAENSIIKLHQQKKNYTEAILLAKNSQYSNNNQLIKLYLASGEIEEAKTLFNQTYPNNKAHHASLFLEFNFFEEALEAIGADKNPNNTSLLLWKAQALLGKYRRKNEDLFSIADEILQLTTLGREKCIQIENGGKNNPMPQLVAKFYIIEARLYFLLNIRYLKNIRKRRKKTTYKDDSGLFINIQNYIYRNRVNEIHKEFKDKQYKPVAFPNDFSLNNHEVLFNKAIHILDRAYAKVVNEGEFEAKEALLELKTPSVEELWNLYWLHFNAGDYETCKKNLDCINHKQADHPNVYQEKGRIALKLGQYDTAESCLKQAILLFEKYTERSADAYNLLQNVYSETLENNKLTLEQKNKTIHHLNASFEAWFKSDVELFNNLDDIYPTFGPRYNDTITSIKEQTIYKYYTFNLNCISAISDEKIYFSKPQQLNDPFDMDGYLEAINQKDFSYVSDQVKNKVTCFCSTLQNDNLQMWAHYADSFRGICVGYRFLELPRDIAWRSLSYPDDKKADRALLEKLFIKSKNWAYEKEIRFLKFSENSQLITISPSKNQSSIDGYITEIILGSRFDIEKNGPVLHAVLNQINSKYEQVGIDPIKVFQAQECRADKSDSLDILPLEEV